MSQDHEKDLSYRDIKRVILRLTRKIVWKKWTDNGTKILFIIIHTLSIVYKGDKINPKSSFDKVFKRSGSKLKLLGKLKNTS